jgi:glycerophosphoryl diester phosphodiesterase
MRVRSLVTAGLLLASSLLGCIQPVAAASVNCPTAIAHRGNAYWNSPIENSMNAFTTSFNVGTQWVETDMHFTKDNVPVLMHDGTVDATTTGTGLISGMTAAQFTALTMNDGIQHPPTLDQLLSLLRSNPKYHTWLEVKDVLTTTQEQIVISKLRGMEGQIILDGLARVKTTMQHLKTADPSLYMALDVYDPVLPVPTGFSSESMSYTYATATNVAQLHAAGVKVYAWTPNNVTNWKTLQGYGIDGIMTNKVQDYINWLTPQGCPVAPPSDPVVTTQDVTTTQAIPFEQQTVYDDTLPSGTSVVTQQGADGVETIVYTITYTDGVETGRVVKSDTITTPATDEITHVGTASGSDPIITTQDVTETQPIPYQQTTVEDPTLPIGTSVVTQQGADGVETIVYTVTYTDGVETDRVVKSDDVTTAPITQITNVGTKQPDPPAVLQFVTNQSFETNLTGWGNATNTSKNTRVAGGYDGSYAIRSINNSTANTKHGFMASPSLVTSTVAGKVYTASVWVKPDVSGQRISIYLQEKNKSGASVNSKTQALITSGTGWQKITNTYTASGNGDSLAFHVLCTNSASQKGFTADLASLTTSN